LLHLVPLKSISFRIYHHLFGLLEKIIQMKRHILTSFLLAGLLVTAFSDQAQTPTVGLLYYDTGTFAGYTLFTPEWNNKVYLIDNCGEIINEWTFAELPGNVCYLLENGTLLRAGQDSLEIRDWDNNILWSYATTANGINQHHDIQPLSNGNIICLVRDIYSKAQIIAQGRDPKLIGWNFWLDKLIELSPVGGHDAEIVWEWKIIDHLIQGFDSTKANYGVVATHPELLDINYDNGNLLDFTHSNAIDYNAELDQIMITSRHLSELYIIDHSTTTLEAAGHSGGNSGMGGDFLWRWGNPQVYQQAGAQEQKLFFPHDAQWVAPGYLDEGKISVFNNFGDGSGTFSSVHLLEPSFEGGVYQMENGIFLPLDYDWSWSGSILGVVVNENNRSGTLSLPNGNVIITQTSLGQVSEITKEGELLWTYKNPSGLVICPQYEIPERNDIFRGEKYPEDFPGFEGQDLTPKGLIEDQNPNSDNCIAIAGIERSKVEQATVVNPVERGTIRFSGAIHADKITIIDITGKTVFFHDFFEGSELSIDLKPGLYLLQLITGSDIDVRKIIVR